VGAAKQLLLIANEDLKADAHLFKAYRKVTAVHIMLVLFLLCVYSSYV
jgi:hypothetical protein